MAAVTTMEKPKETSANDVLSVLSRRVRVILAVAGVSFLIAIFLATRPRSYSATGAIRVQPGTTSEYHTDTKARDVSQPEDKISSEMAIMQSRGLHLQVARELDLVHNKEFWEGETPKSYSLDDPRTRQRLSELMNSALRVYHSPKDEIITLTCTTRSPSLSAKIVNTLIDDYVSYLFEMRLRSTRRVSKWMIGQLADLQKQVSEDQASLVALQGQLGLIGLDPHDTAFLSAQALGSLTGAATTATVDRVMAEAKYRLLAEADPNLIEGEVNLLQQGSGSPSSGTLLETLRSTRATAAAAYANLSARFGPNYPDVLQAKAQLDELDRQVKTEQTRITNQARLAYQAASLNEKQATAQVQQEKARVFQSHGKMVEYASLVNDYNAHRNLYDTLVQRLREAEITSGLEAGEIDIVDVADVPAMPVPPGRLFILSAGILLGLVAGILAALIVELFDTHITTVEQAEKAVNIPIIAVTPHVRERGRDASGRYPAAMRQGSSGYANAIEVLRSTIVRERTDKASTVLMVTSALSNEGRTSTAANLAATLAEYGRDVLLVDCDFYGTGFGEGMTTGGAKAFCGLADVLKGSCTLDQALLQSSEVAQLRLLTRGSLSTPSRHLLGSDAMKAFLEQCRSSFDFVVLDAPPVLGASEALNLGAFADVVLVVVRSGASTRSYLQRAVELLLSLRLPVLGLVLNDSRILQREQAGTAFSNFFAPRRRVS